MSVFSDFGDFALHDQGVLLGEPLLLLDLIVVVTAVLLGISVLPAEHIVALAREAEQAHLAIALPTYGLVSLHFSLTNFLPGRVSLEAPTWLPPPMQQQMVARPPPRGGHPQAG